MDSVVIIISLYSKLVIYNIAGELYFGVFYLPLKVTASIKVLQRI